VWGLQLKGIHREIGEPWNGEVATDWTERAS
jgi:hypothetical protein